MSQDSPPPTSLPAKTLREGSMAGLTRRGAAKLVGVIAAALLLFECASFAILKALSLRDQAKASAELALPAYRDQPWARTYWREHLKSSAQSYEAYPFGLWRSRPFVGETLNVD